MPSEKQPPKKTHEELVQQEVTKQRVRFEAEQLLQDELVQAEIAKQSRRNKVQQFILQSAQGSKSRGIGHHEALKPFNLILSSVDSQQDKSHKKTKELSLHEKEITSTESESRSETLSAADAIAQMLRHRNISPRDLVLVKTHTVSEQHLITERETRRIVNRGKSPRTDDGSFVVGSRRNEKLKKKQILGMHVTEYREEVARGWRLPLPEKFNEPGTHLVLTESGEIISLRGQSTTLGEINTGNTAVSLNSEAPNEGVGKDSGVLLVNRLEYSFLNDSYDSDIAAMPRPINNPDGSHEMFVRREMQIRRALATLATEQGIKE